MNKAYELRKVEFNHKVITYTLIKKQVKNINLRIKSDKTIFVSANKSVSVNYIDKFVLSKADFILRVLDKYDKKKQYNIEDKKYITGDTFRVLGGVLSLKVILEKDLPEGATLEEDGIVLRVKDCENLGRKKIIMDKWFKRQQELLFKGVSDEIYNLLLKYGVPYPEIKIKTMKSRWGSCQPVNGIITLNSKLFQAPIECIQYVVLHEYVHFIHPNHSREFHNFVQELMPDWKDRRNKLEYND